MHVVAACVGLLWIGTSSLWSTYANGLFLRTFNDAFAHLFVRFAFSGLLGLCYCGAVARPLLVALPRLARRLLPLSALLLAANLLNSMSLQRAGVTVTYVVKSLIPFFTVLMCWWRGQRFGLRVYVSLVPVCFGVSLASATDVDVNASGLLCALGSALSQTLLNVTSKERIQECQLTGAEAFLVMALVCVVLSAPLLLLSYPRADGFLHGCLGGRSAEGAWSPLAVVLMAAGSYHVEYTLNFVFVALCCPLAFSVTDILRRLGTITFGAYAFSKPLSALNAAGVVTSLLGVFCYTAVTKLSARDAVAPRQVRFPAAEPSPQPATQLGRPKAIGDWPAHYRLRLRPLTRARSAKGEAQLEPEAAEPESPSTSPKDAGSVDW